MAFSQLSKISIGAIFVTMIFLHHLTNLAENFRYSHTYIVAVN